MPSYAQQINGRAGETATFLFSLCFYQLPARRFAPRYLTSAAEIIEKTRDKYLSALIGYP